MQGPCKRKKAPRASEEEAAWECSHLDRHCWPLWSMGAVIPLYRSFVAVL